MNTYVKLNGIASTFLLIQSNDQVPVSIAQNREQVLVDNMEQGLKDDSIEGMTKAKNAFLALSSGLSIDYAEVAKRFPHGIVVNPKGGYMGFEPENVSEQWTAESCKEAIC